MEDLQNKLEQYRIRKRRKETLNAFKERIKTGFKNFIMSGSKKNEVAIKVDEEEEEPRTSIASKALMKTYPNEAEPLLDSESEDDISTVEPKEEHRMLRYIIYFVYFLFWVTLYTIAIELQFGIVFLMISALFFICLNTRTGKKSENEISAYSVFNKNCVAIDGTLKAEQLERELYFGSAMGK